MNVIFLTQSSSLRMFYELAQTLRGPLQLEKIGFLVTDHIYYRQFREQVPDIESGGYTLLKEWEITGRAKKLRPDTKKLQKYELELGDPGLWGALVADRRVYLGEKCTFRQDYRPRFSHEQMLGILQAGLVDIERLFDEVRPDFVVSFICVTFGEYLAYLLARSRGVPFLNLRPTRIKNYVTYGSTVFEPSDRIRKAYEEYCSGGNKDRWTKEAGEYIDFVQAEHAMYEGVINTTLTPRSKGSALSRIPGSIARLVRKEYEYRFGQVKDNHVPGVLVPFLYNRLLNPLQTRWNDKVLSPGYVRENDLRSMDYVFFPLHTEPEVSLLVYSRPYLNQIEVIRNISHNIPVGMTVVVKEHPVAVGKRPLGYYRKILEIPNVRLAAPALKSRTLVENAWLVTTIAGSIGWEAVLRRKPVVTFGRTPYQFLPNTMIRGVGDPWHLGSEIQELTKTYTYREEAVIAYVAATMRESVPVNLYSTLLGRQGVYTGGDGTAGSGNALREDIDRLADYTIKSLEKYS